MKIQISAEEFLSELTFENLYEKIRAHMSDYRVGSTRSRVTNYYFYNCMINSVLTIYFKCKDRDHFSVEMYFNLVKSGYRDDASGHSECFNVIVITKDGEFSVSTDAELNYEDIKHKNILQLLLPNMPAKRAR
jgi:hypothetical protein